MKEIELFVHVEGEASPRQIKAIENALVGDVLKQLFSERHGEYILMFEEVILEPEKHLHHHGVGHHHHIHARRKVEIKINGKPRWTHKGQNSVQHLRSIGLVPADEILAEFKDGKYVDLPDNGHVEICGGEIFASHVKSGGSS